jgi:hypothetical protein
MSLAPTFAGLSGQKLMVSVTTIATMGFLLFGYDRMFIIILSGRRTR